MYFLHVRYKIDSADDGICDCFSYGHVFIFVKITPLKSAHVSPFIRWQSHFTPTNESPSPHCYAVLRNCWDTHE